MNGMFAWVRCYMHKMCWFRPNWTWIGWGFEWVEVNLHTLDNSHKLIVEKWKFNENQTLSLSPPVSLSLTIYLFIYLYIYIYIYRCIDVDHAPYRPHWEISLKTNCSWRWLCKNPYTNNKSTTIHCISITKSIMYHTLNYIYVFDRKYLFIRLYIRLCAVCIVVVLYIVDI